MRNKTKAKQLADIIMEHEAAHIKLFMKAEKERDKILKKLFAVTKKYKTSSFSSKSGSPTLK